MKTLTRVQMLLLLGGCLLRPAFAELCSCWGEDGAMHYGPPADSRYDSVFPDESASAAETAAADGFALRSLAGKLRFDRLVEQVARSHGLEGALLHAVISVESRYDPNAVSRRGASGLMQLMPATAKRFGVIDAFDPEQNLRGGARYLRYLLNMFDRDVKLALAAYHAGEGAVLRHGRRIPPLSETEKYVPLVLAFFRKYRAKT